MKHQIISASDSSVLVRFGEEISPAHHRQVRRLSRWLMEQDWPFVRNIHPAYATVLVSYDPLLADFEEVELRLCQALALLTEMPDPPQRTVELPVCYGGALGPDLAGVADHCGLTGDEVVRRHAAGEYLVYFLGFSPGFPYLGGLDGSLATPRLESPRHDVPAGSVAIGGSQTGVYPMRSPGGWRLIGRTPVPLFDPAADPPALLEMGDRVRFVPISMDEYTRLEKETER
jgi:inhibitor of KinA